MAKTAPLAPLAEDTVSEVAVANCAFAAAPDNPINNAAHKEVRGRLQEVVLPRLFAFFETSNVLPKICGDPVASSGSAGPKRDRESTPFATAEDKSTQREHDAVFNDGAERQ
jgi:hypothetical protein